MNDDLEDQLTKIICEEIEAEQCAIVAKTLGISIELAPIFLQILEKNMKKVCEK